MTNLIRGEFYKLRKSRCLIWMTVLWALFTFFYAWFAIRDAGRNSGFATIICGLREMENFLSIQVGVNFLYAAFAGMFICNDFAGDTLNRTFTYGYSRKEVLASKLTAYVLCSLLFEMTATVVIGVTFSALYGFGSIKEINVTWFLFRSMFLGMLGMMATALMTAAVAVISKSIMATLGSAVVVIAAVIFSSSFPWLEKVVTCILPCQAVMMGMSPFAGVPDIMVAVVSSVAVAVISVLVMMKHLSKLDMK